MQTAGLFGRVRRALSFMVAAMALLFVAAAEPSYAQSKRSPQKPSWGGVSATKSKSSGPAPQWYASLVFRHHINTFYDTDGYLGRQEPTVHARAQFGAQFYDRMLDVYGTVGVYKRPETQQVLQRRPELSIDFYPFSGTYFSLLQYNTVQFPFEAREQDPEADVTSSEAGSVYTVGVAPMAKYPFTWFNSKWKWKAGVDGWTKMYSRKQYTGDYESENEDEEGRLSLTSSKEEDESIEDFANHYENLAMLGLQVKPSLINGLMGEASATYQSEYRPRYTKTVTGTEYEYGVTRYSYYKLRLKYAISSRVSVVNDFYHFHGGLFESKRSEEDRRFRNIARLTLKL